MYKAKVEELKQIFPEKHDLVLLGALNRTNGDVQEATNLLLEVSSGNKKKSVNGSGKKPSQKHGWKSIDQSSPTKLKYSSSRTVSTSSQNNHPYDQISDMESIKSPQSSHHVTSSTSKSNSKSVSKNTSTSYESDGPDQELYKSERHDAIKLRRQMQKLREKAHKAYLAGDDETSRQLRTQADSISGELSVLQEEAAQRIFEANNPNPESAPNNSTSIDAFGIPTSLYRLDLHGLHSDEAIYFVQDRIEDLAIRWNEAMRNGQFGLASCSPLQIITGHGVHQSANSVLRPAVEAYLSENKFIFDSRTGSFLVTIPDVEMLQALTS